MKQKKRVFWQWKFLAHLNFVILLRILLERISEFELSASVLLKQKRWTNSLFFVLRVNPTPHRLGRVHPNHTGACTRRERPIPRSCKSKVINVKGWELLNFVLPNIDWATGSVAQSEGSLLSDFWTEFLITEEREEAEYRLLSKLACEFDFKRHEFNSVGFLLGWRHVASSYTWHCPLVLQYFLLSLFHWEESLRLQVANVHFLSVVNRLPYHLEVSLTVFLDFR